MFGSFSCMGDTIKITYETLFDMLRNEKNREELQQINKSFFSDVLNYMQDKQKLAADSKGSALFSGMESQKAKRQLENIQKIVKELYERREKKIIMMALIASRTKSVVDRSALLDEEKQMLEELTEVLDRSREGVLFRLLSLESPHLRTAEPLQQNSTQPGESEEFAAPTNASATVMVRFLQPVPKFLGKEMEVYGPFDEEDITTVPAVIAKILIEKGRAEEIRG